MTNALLQRTPAMELVTVTPDMARAWLECNTRNRRLVASVVDRYAATMTRGLWRHPTGEAIIFDRTGVLQDGQHRLAAQVRANAAISYYVLFDADPDDFVVIDQGRSRTPGDVLSIHGVPNGKTLVAIARTFLSMCEIQTQVWEGRAASMPSATVIDYALREQDALRHHASLGGEAFNAARLPKVAYAAVGLYVETISHGMDQWHNFHEEVVSGTMLTEGSPAYALRKWSISRTNGNTGGRLRQQGQVVYISKAWNAYVADRPIKVLRWGASEWPMPLPDPATY